MWHRAAAEARTVDEQPQRTHRRCGRGGGGAGRAGRRTDAGPRAARRAAECCAMVMAVSQNQIAIRKCGRCGRKTINLMHGAADTSPRRQATRKRAHARASCPGDGAGRLLCGRDARATHTHSAGADAVDEIRKGEIQRVCKTKLDQGGQQSVPVGKKKGHIPPTPGGRPCRFNAATRRPVWPSTLLVMKWRCGRWSTIFSGARTAAAAWAQNRHRKKNKN